MANLGVDGSTWSLRATSGPSPRDNLAMTYDAARGVTVLFGGGQNFHSHDGDTWEWNGSTWTLRSSGGPSARSRHAMVYDAERSVTVLFGGFRGAFEGDTWVWDGEGDAAWTNYGSGWPGTGGIASFTSTGDPVLCTTVTLALGNSRGATTQAALFLGTASADQLTIYDGHLLVAPTNIVVLTLPGSGLALAGAVPCDGRALRSLDLPPGAGVWILALRRASRSRAGSGWSSARTDGVISNFQCSFLRRI
jgi:hypothetical protein